MTRDCWWLQSRRRRPDKESGKGAAWPRLPPACWSWRRGRWRDWTADAFYVPHSDDNAVSGHRKNIPLRASA